MGEYAQILANILLTSSVYLLCAISYAYIYYVSRAFNIAHAGIITLSPYFVYLFYYHTGLSFIVALIASLLTAAFLGGAFDFMIFRYMRKRGMPALNYLLVSIGLYVILQNSISLIAGDEPKSVGLVTVAVGHQFLGAYLTTLQLLTILISLTLFVLVSIVLRYTRTGNVIRAIVENPELSKIFGIDTERVILVVFIASSGIAGITGILSAIDTGMTPTFGFNLFLYGVVVIIIGGVGSYKGLLGASFLVATAQHFTAYFISVKWMDAVAFVFLISFLAWRPLGFNGKRLKKVEV